MKEQERVVDINDFRSLLTVLGLTCFLGIAAWAYSGKARKGFDEAAQIPFTEDDLPGETSGQSKKG